MIPTEIAAHLKSELNITIQNTHSISGGSINQAVKINDGRDDYFLKWNLSAPDDFFEKEADGLNLLRSAGTSLRIPEVRACGRPSEIAPGFLLMEYVDEEKKGDSFVFGAELAKLHQTRADYFGLDVDNYIGSLPQSNRHHDSWNSFFVNERINPQLKKAVDSALLNHSLIRNWERLSSQLDELLPACKPSLIHGDLWGGNYLFDKTGRAVLIDPAVYYGHPEMDVAFTKMFGGFSPEFYKGYESVSPLEPGFSDRVPVCNLYPLLVHVNLFGGHYASQCSRFLQKF
ncbi:fructosamine kinase family protein [soil metagenome]